MINLLILIMLWVVTIGLAALCGYLLALQSKNKRKSTATPKEPTTAEKKEMERAQREYENFMTYTGKPQDNISEE